MRPEGRGRVPTDIAGEVVRAIVDSLSDHDGFNGWWNEFDAETRSDILDGLREITFSLQRQEIGALKKCVCELMGLATTSEEYVDDTARTELFDRCHKLDCFIPPIKQP